MWSEFYNFVQTCSRDIKTAGQAMMDPDLGDILHSERQLKDSLHSDDKEKLRRKLALLQREYVNTVQRLQRAERMEAVRQHVRSRITRKDPDDRSNLSRSSSVLNSIISNLPASQENSEDPDSSRRNPVIRFMLPPEGEYPQTPDSRTDITRTHRPSPALRLRSRRSRQRWEMRSNEPSRSGDRSQQGPEQMDKEEDAKVLEAKEDDVVSGSEALFSDADSESPSLLLTHWNTQRCTETIDLLGKQRESVPEGKANTGLEINGTSGKDVAAITEIEQNDSKDDKTKSKEKGDLDDCERNCFENKEKTSDTRVDYSKTDDIVEIKEDKNGILDSCTLVEGLLFPAEYYVRTTRRMTLSQSQPDMQAVILSHLSASRKRRSRGPSSSTYREVHRSTQDSQTNCSPPTSFNQSSVNPSIECIQSLSDLSDPIRDLQANSGARSVPTKPAPRGRRRRRGGGRRRGGPALLKQGCEQTLRDLHSSIPTSSSLLVPDSDKASDSEPLGELSNIHMGPSPPPVGSGAEQQPDFLKSTFKQSIAPQTNTGTSSFQSYLLPSVSSPLQTFQPSPPALFSDMLLTHLKSLDIQQDFHLPDDQFASLKLHKLRQIAVEMGLEHFSTPSHNTRSSLRRHSSHCDITDLLTPPPLPLSLTPRIAHSQHPNEEQQDAPQPEQQPTDKQTGGVTGAFKDPQLQIESHNSVTESLVLEEELETVVSLNCAQPHAHQDFAAFEENTQMTGHFEDPETELPVFGKQDCCSVDRSKAPLEEFCSSRAVKPTESNDKLPMHSTDALDSSIEANSNCPGDNVMDKKASCEPPQTEILVKSPPTSANCPFVTPLPPSSTLPTTPILPSLGASPNRPFSLVLPHISSPSAPSLSPPPPHTTPALDLSPPDLSPRPVDSVDLNTSELQIPVEETAGKRMKRTHTLKAAAGGSLVDLCCFGLSGSLCVAAAGKWAVCLWSQTSATSDWSLQNTWTFSEPVISVFPAPDSAGLICVTLGQLEIKELRLVSCSSLSQMLICEGLMQVVVGVSMSRVVSSSPSATGSALQVFTLSDSSSSSSPQPLVSPGVCVSALAPVDGLPDALIGTDDGGHLFIWNLRSSQLLSSISLGLGLLHTSCLRGFSYSGVLLVLLQHQFPSSLDQTEKEETITDPLLSKDTKTTLFSLVGLNPLNGKSSILSRLHPPETWSGRLCEADVEGSTVVGLSLSGCLCVWELGEGGAPQTTEAPEGEDWQLIRWGQGDTLVIGHHSGDVSLHQYGCL